MPCIKLNPDHFNLSLKASSTAANPKIISCTPIHGFFVHLRLKVAAEKVKGGNGPYFSDGRFEEQKKHNFDWFCLFSSALPSDRRSEGRVRRPPANELRNQVAGLQTTSFFSFVSWSFPYDTMLDPEDKLNHDSYGQFLVIFHNN